MPLLTTTTHRTYILHYLRCSLVIDIIRHQNNLGFLRTWGREHYKDTRWLPCMHFKCTYPKQISRKHHQQNRKKKKRQQQINRVLEISFILFMLKPGDIRSLRAFVITHEKNNYLINCHAIVGISRRNKMPCFSYFMQIFFIYRMTFKISNDVWYRILMAVVNVCTYCILVYLCFHVDKMDFRYEQFACNQIVDGQQQKSVSTALFSTYDLVMFLNQP